MPRFASSAVFLLAAGCWLAAGSGGGTIQAMIACEHHETHHVPHGDHPGAPTDGPCFCDEMTGGSMAVLSPALPAPVAAQLEIAAVVAVPTHPARVAPPPSPSFAPTPPPPNGLV